MSFWRRIGTLEIVLDEDDGDTTPFLAFPHVGRAAD
jgi:hypothetical protein